MLHWFCAISVEVLGAVYYSNRGQYWAACTRWGTEWEAVLEAPLSREDPRTVSMAQERPPGCFWLLDAAQIVHRNQEVLFIVHLEWRIGKYSEKGDIERNCLVWIPVGNVLNLFKWRIYVPEVPILFDILMLFLLGRYFVIWVVFVNWNWAAF